MRQYRTSSPVDHDHVGLHDDAFGWDSDWTDVADGVFDEPELARPARGYGRSPDSAGRAHSRRQPVWPRVAVWFGAVLMVLSGGSLASMKLLVDRYTGAVDQQSMLGGAAVGTGGDPLKGPLNILLVGVDERTEQDDPNGTRADSIIVLHVPADHRSAYLLSIPRDTLVEIPRFPKSRYGGGREKINSAFQHGSDNGGGRAGGFELLAATVRNATGIAFNAGAIVNFAGFEAVVSALGGVTMCIDQRVTSIHKDTNGQKLTKGAEPAVYRPGCYHLKAWQALDYVRQRHTSGGDYDRQRHQQQFLKAIANQAMSKGVITNPGKLDAVLTAAGHALTVDPGRAKLTDWVFLFKGIGTAGLAMLKTNGGQFDSVPCPDGTSCEQLTAESRSMFEAARNDRLQEFVSTHPSWLARDR
jgi:LCP family protein required for cell wall assembly